MMTHSATSQNSHGATVDVYHYGDDAADSLYFSEFLRQQHRSFLPPRSRVYTLVDSQTYHIHVATLSWDRVTLVEELVHQVRVEWRDRDAFDEVGDWVCDLVRVTSPDNC